MSAPLILSSTNGKGEAREVAPSACASRDHVDFLLPESLQLFLGLEPDDGLMHQHMVQNASERIPRILAGHGIFNSFADGNPKAPRGVRIFFQNLSACIRVLARAGHAGRTPGVHHQAAVGLLVIADPDHVDLALQAEETACEAEGASPLTRTRFGCNSFDAEDFVVIGLGDGCIRFVAPRGAHSFILVVNPRRGPQGLFQGIGSLERRGSPDKKLFHHLFRNVDPSLLAHFLFNQIHRKHGGQVFGTDRFSCRRVDDRLKRTRQIGLDVVPLPRNVIFTQKHLVLLHL